MRKATLASFAFVAVLQVLAVATPSTAQIANPYPQIVKQVPAPLPRVALNGAIGETRNGLQYHKIILMITNWEKFPPQIFVHPIGMILPPNSCGESTRVVMTIKSEPGTPVTGCIHIAKPADLGKFAFVVQKGKPVPQFVYVVVTDLHTGAAYRSNLVSPWSGATK